MQVFPTYNNQLKNVSDAVSSGNSMGFVDGNTNPALADYEYDQNGNMILDRNKGIQSISYNHLNLPTKIIWSNNKYISYTYNAAGQKVSKSVRENDSIKVVDYLDGFQYAGRALQFFPHAEGYVKATSMNRQNTNYAYNYVFNYTDHLGNVRLSYSKDPQTGVLEILDENHYYPFGLKHEVYVSADKKEFDLLIDGGIGEVALKEVLKTEYMYKYNGKELQTDLDINLYDYGARNYDPAIGRWFNVDPLAEQMRRHSPYNYAFNNPIRFIDPDGKAPYDHIFIWKNGKLTMYDNKNGSSLIYINGVLMSDLDLDVKQNRILIANVAAYYANSIGHKTNVYGGEGKMIFGLSPIEEERESSTINPAFTYGNDIYINRMAFNLNCEISNYYDFISIIEHEVIHKESDHGFKDITSLDHAEVYMKQIGSKNFDKTTSRFKKSMVNSFVNQLNEANKEFGIGKKQVEMMNSVNSRLEDLGVDYRVHEKLGSGNYEVR